MNAMRGLIVVIKTVSILMGPTHVLAELATDFCQMGTIAQVTSVHVSRSKEKYIAT